MPGSTLPVPTAPYMLSPLPASILQEGSNPYFCTRFLPMAPMERSDGLRGGIFAGKSGEMDCITAFDHSPLPGCHSAMPEVSPGSISRTPPSLPPVKYQLIKLCTRKQVVVLANASGSCLVR